ncbi:MAG: TAXI family TRAP transporter solute-binding subunit [Alphaproteobacteria bacterium]|nr:TAXI family TRAP transporter solute-binding subunit [Alphaproteobacteria bacterium]
MFGSRLSLSFAAGVLATFLGWTPGAQAQQLNMGGSTTTSPYFAYYSSLAETISRRTSLNVTVISAGGFTANAQQMRQGRMQFGGMAPDLMEEAAADPRAPFKEFRVLWWFAVAPQYIVVRADSGVEALKDLDGKCFHPGQTGSSSEKNMIQILKAIGVAPQLHLSDSRDAINAIKNRRCIGQVRTGAAGRLDASTEELSLTTPLRLLGYSADQVAKIKAAVPWMPFIEQPAGILKGAPAFTTHGNPTGMAATTTMTAETAYQIVKAMWEGIDAQRAAFRDLQGIDVPAMTLASSGSFLHAGAIRYYRELGLKVPEGLVPPEAR